MREARRGARDCPTGMTRPRPGHPVLAISGGVWPALDVCPAVCLVFPSAARCLPVCHVTEQAEQSRTLISADMINEEEAGAAESARQHTSASGVVVR